MSYKFVILNASFEEQKKSFFFSSREFFNCSSLCDICLNDPSAILEALKRDSEEIEMNKGCLIDTVLEPYSESIKKNFNVIGLSEPSRIISLDFNFMSQIYKAIKMNSMSSVKILLNTLFNNHNYKYYSATIMLELPFIFEIEDFSSMYGFLCRTNSELENEYKQYCSIETAVFDQTLPLISDRRMQSTFVKKFDRVDDNQTQVSAMI